MLSSLATYLAALVIAFLITYVMVPASMKIATKVGAIDMPSERRVHTKPTTRMGGIALFAGMFITCLLVMGAGTRTGIVADDFTFRTASTFDVALISLGFCVMFAVGVADDILQLRVRTKFLGQVVAAAIITAAGVVMGGLNITGLDLFIDFGIFAYPITIFYLVAFANIINLIDGLDGLAAGVAGISATAFVILSLMGNIQPAVIMSLTIVGSCLAFLRFNFHPAKLFMGDCGSLCLGFGLGIVSLAGTMRYSGLASLAVPVVIAAVPVIDTFAAIVRRKLKGVSIGTPDKNHIHHVLLNRGFSQRHVVLDIYAMCAIFSATAIAIYRASTVVAVGVLVADVLFAAFLIWRLGLFGKVMGRFYLEGRLSLFPKKRAEQEAALDVIRRERGLIEEIDPNVTRVLFVSQHYWPEPFNSTDICEELVRRGYHVTVLTGQPNYPEGELYPGYENSQVFYEEHNGVHIMRCKLRPRHKGALNRFLNYYSFQRRGTSLARFLGEGFDVVYSYQTSPVMMATPALQVAKKFGTPVLLHAVDIWPESLMNEGFRPGGLAYGYYKSVSRRIYSEADRLIVDVNADRLSLCGSLGVREEDVIRIPAWADGGSSKEEFFGTLCGLFTELKGTRHGS